LSATTTHFADLNELACAYVLNGERWFDDEARRQFDVKNKLLPRADAVIACTRGKVMGEKLRAEWQGNTGKLLRPERVFWCARNPSAILPKCSQKHPADILLALHGGTWLGVSAKSRDGGNVGSGMKNPGLGTISTALGLNLDKLVQDSTASIISEHAELLNARNSTERKKVIRTNIDIQNHTRDEGAHLAIRVRDAIFDVLQSLPREKVESFVRSLLDCGSDTYPPYVRLVGTGDGSSKLPFSASLYDPWKVRLDGTLTPVGVGDQSIGFKNDYERICKLRVKWESEPFASTLKFSVDEWD